MMNKRTFCFLTTLALVFSSEQLYADHPGEYYDGHRHITYRTRTHYGAYDGTYLGDSRTRVVSRSRVIHRPYGHRYESGRRVYVSDRDHHHHDQNVNDLLVGLAIALPLILHADHRHHGRGSRYGRGY